MNRMMSITLKNQVLWECLLLLIVCLASYGSTPAVAGCSSAPQDDDDDDDRQQHEYLRRLQQQSNEDDDVVDNLVPCGTEQGTVRQVVTARRAEQDYFRALALKQLGENATLWERIRAYFGYNLSYEKDSKLSDDDSALHFNPHYWFSWGAPQTVVPVYYHVIRPSNTSNKAMTQSPDRARIVLQHQVLNDSFNKTVFSFDLKNVSFIVNDTWYYAEATNDGDMKQALRVGGRDTLNVYIRSDSNICGYATFPFTALIGSLDGVVVNDLCIAGSNSTRRGLGLTLVHEVGHWLGLFHTFEHGCWFPGDAIHDTPYEGSPYYVCPNATTADDDNDAAVVVVRNSCRFKPGDDPYKNYMDYTADTCRDHFTPGQIRRMTAMWGTFRS